jgi:uncharacterized membrane protein YtjA (UPF0391 family)
VAAPTKGQIMLQLILILLVVAAIAGLLGFNFISGAALTGAKILIGVVLILFLLALLGIVAIA